MSRTMPSYCEHGKVIDWGDFGSEPEYCAACEEAALYRVHVTVEWGKHSDVPEGTIHATISHAIEHLMEQLLCMGVTDPCIDADGLAYREGTPE